MTSILMLAIALVAIHIVDRKTARSAILMTMAGFSFPFTTFAVGSLAWFMGGLTGIMPWSPYTWWLCCLCLGLPVGGLVTWNLVRVLE